MTDEKMEAARRADARREALEEGRREAAASRFPTWGDLLVFLGIFLLGQAAGSIVAFAVWGRMPDMALAATGDIEAQRAVGAFNAVLYGVAMAFTLCGALLYRYKRGGNTVAPRCSLRGLNPVLLLWGVVLLLATVVVIEPLLMLLPEVPNVYGRGGWAVLTLVVLAPLFEELLFRGMLLESLRKRRGLIRALLISSLLFGVVHLHPTVAVNAAIMGLILGFIYLLTDSIWASIFLHAVNNGLSYILLVAGLGGATLRESLDNPSLYAAVYAVAAALFLAACAMMVRKVRRLREEEVWPFPASEAEAAAGPSGEAEPENGTSEEEKIDPQA